MVNHVRSGKRTASIGLVSPCCCLFQLQQELQQQREQQLANALYAVYNEMEVKMKQYECLTPAEVRDTWYRISNTRSTARTKQERKEEHDWWYSVCQEIRKAARKGIRNVDSWDGWFMHDENDNEHEVTLNIGYDTGNGVFLVWEE